MDKLSKQQPTSQDSNGDAAAGSSTASHHIGDAAPRFARPVAEQQPHVTESPSANTSGSVSSNSPWQQGQHFSSSINNSSSNVLDIDQVLAPRQHMPPAQQPITYQEATAGDAPAGSSSQQQQQQLPPSNELVIDDINFEDDQQQRGGSSSTSSSSTAGRKTSAAYPQSQQQQQQQQQQALPRHLGRPVGGGMPDFLASGELELVRHLNLDGIFLDKQESVTHDVGLLADQQQQQLTDQQQQQQQRHRRHRQQDQQQQQQLPTSPGLPLPSSARHPSSRVSSSRKHKQQQQQQQGPQLKYSQPRPHPLYLKPRHVKTHFKVPTSDGWKLHLIRTQVLNTPPSHLHPVILCPGLGSSGAYSFDLSPNVSLADYLAGKGWDVWTCELRGNGMSDKPALFSSRSRWWTIDDYVEKDVPAIIRFVRKETHAPQVHFLGHSMGGMILCGVMARVDRTTAKIRSCIAVGSGLFLEESWWRLFERLKVLSNAIWIVPSGTLLRNYARLMFGPYAIPYLDMLYFWPSNVDPQVGRAMMRRNFSNISVGVIQQMTTAFGDKGLLSADKRMVYADPGRLAKVSAPALFLVGDRDRMCPAEGCRRTWQMFGSPQKRFICLGPASGFSDHYGHFDILMGKRVEREVFPLIHNFLLQHDTPRPQPRL